LPRNKRHYRLTVADALSAHDRALRSSGGLSGVLDLGSVESAISRPYTGYYRSMPRKAAALIESMCTNHGFVDGNKRTTLILAMLLLSKSGYRLAPKRGDGGRQLAMERIILSVARRERSFNGLLCWISNRLVRL
jgi:death-on-curing protein